MAKSTFSRSSGSGTVWYRQLKQMAEKDEMPGYIGGDLETRSQVFRAIDKLYSMPQTDAKIVDQDTGVIIHFNRRSTRASYPSGAAASPAEKRGVLKMLLYNSLRK